MNYLLIRKEETLKSFRILSPKCIIYFYSPNISIRIKIGKRIKVKVTLFNTGLNLIETTFLSRMKRNFVYLSDS